MHIIKLSLNDSQFYEKKIQSNNIVNQYELINYLTEILSAFVDCELWLKLFFFLQIKNMSRILRIACIQLKVTNDKESNVQRALTKIREAKQCGAQLICLPGEESTS